MSKAFFENVGFKKIFGEREETIVQVLYEAGPDIRGGKGERIESFQETGQIWMVEGGGGGRLNIRGRSLTGYEC